MLKYLTVPVTPFQQNCSIVWCDETRDAAVIDPGGDLDVLLAEVEQRGLHLTQILQTHAHIDHAGATGELADSFKLPIVGPHPADQFWIDALPQQSRMFGFPDAEPFTPTRWLADGSFLPSDAFDCLVITQTIHLIYDVRAAVATLHRILKPGGQVLILDLADDFLDQVLDGDQLDFREAGDVGRVVYTQWLDDRGGILADAMARKGAEVMGIDTHGLTKVQAADQALYAAKLGGRNLVRFVGRDDAPVFAGGLRRLATGVLCAGTALRG